MRRTKSLISLVFIFSSIFIQLAGRPDFRAKTDEFSNTRGVVSILETGTLQESYISGHLYEISTAQVLILTDNSISSLDWLSPLITVLPLVTIVLVGLSISKSNYNIDHLNILVFGLILVSIPEIVGPMRETSHKAFTFSLSMVVILLTILSATTGGNSTKFKILLMISQFSLTLYNYIWSLFALLSAVLILLYIQIDSQKTSVYQTISTIAALSLSAVLFVPGIGYRQVVYRILIIRSGIFQKLFGVTSGQTANQTGLLARISAYGSIDILGFSISKWLIFSTGSLLAGVLCLVSVGICLKRFKNRNHGVLDFILLVVCLVYGGALVGTIASGDAIVSKRFIPWLVIFGTIYFCSVHTQSEYNYKRFVTVLMIVCLVFSVPAAQFRYAPVGNDSPREIYLDDSGFAKVEWATTYSEDSLVFTRPSEKYLSAKLYRKVIPTADCNIHYDNVYDNHNRCSGKLIYSKNQLNLTAEI